MKYFSYIEWLIVTVKSYEKSQRDSLCGITEWLGISVSKYVMANLAPPLLKMKTIHKNPGILADHLISYLIRQTSCVPGSHDNISKPCTEWQASKFKDNL